MNTETFNPREFAKEKVAERPQIDLERREIPSDVGTPFDDYNAGYADGFKCGLAVGMTDHKSVSSILQGMKL